MEILLSGNVITAEKRLESEPKTGLTEVQARQRTQRHHLLDIVLVRLDRTVAKRLQNASILLVWRHRLRHRLLVFVKALFILRMLRNCQRAKRQLLRHNSEDQPRE